MRQEELQEGAITDQMHYRVHDCCTTASVTDWFFQDSINDFRTFKLSSSSVPVTLGVLGGDLFINPISTVTLSCQS